MILDRPLRFSVFVILLAAGVALRAGPLLRSADTAKGTQAALIGWRPFVLTVLGPDGKALPGVPVEFRVEPPLTANQIREGRFLRAETTGVFIQATEQGRVVLEVAKDAKRLDVVIQTAGYAPYLAQWGATFRPDPIPAAFTARLGAGYSIGGIIDDGEGRPVAGVHVISQIAYQRPPGVYRGSYFAHFAVSDAAGKWHFDCVPASMQQVVLELDHQDFMPRSYLATRNEFGLDPGREPVARQFIKKGRIVTGKVTDETGKPIAGALVRTWHRNMLRQAVTAADGVYHLRGCGAWTARVVASAAGRAVRGEGSFSRGQVDRLSAKARRQDPHSRRDQRGNPVPGFHVLFQEWRGSVPFPDFDIVNRTADERGIWEWHEAPPEAVLADVHRPGDPSTRVELLASRKQEYDVVLTSQTEVSGSVVDKETRQPIKKFHVIVSRRARGQSLFLFPRGWSETAGAGGHYQIYVRRFGNTEQGLRIEADGYEPVESRDIKSTEDKVVIDFELKRGADVEGVVLTPEGRPAVKARVALVSGISRVTLTNGAIDPQQTGADWCETDAAGHFHFPPQNSRFAFVVTHESGYAVYHAASQSNRRMTNLDPWTRVEGTYRVGGKPLANVPIALSDAQQALARFGLGNLDTSDRVTTDKDGHFEFRHVMAGRGFVHRAIGWAAQGDPADIPSADSTEVAFPLGQTVRLDLNEPGRDVIGRLKAPAGFKQPIPWQQAIVEAELDRRDDREASLRVSGRVAPDGTFRFDHLFPGAYLLDVHFPRPSVGHLWEHAIGVPKNRDPRTPKPHDLGVLTLEKE